VAGPSSRDLNAMSRTRVGRHQPKLLRTYSGAT
jgi:hypothetical protein